MISGRQCIGFLVALLLPAVTQARVFVSDQVITKPTPDLFSVCYGHTCKTVQQVSLNQEQWANIGGLFTPRPESAEQERRAIAQAIAALETVIGPITNTTNDKGYNLEGFSAKGNQMDCIDESTNSTTYLSMMEQAGWLKWHRVADPVTRGFFIFGWPHTTAVIESKENQQAWAVDSWFYDNGHAPAILPLEQWKDGWSPEEQ